jgi:O-antigen ligase
MAICVVPCLLSGSRIAVLSSVVGAAIIFGVERKKMAYVLPVVALLGVSLYLFSDKIMPDETALADLGLTELAAKGNVNTREGLWKARIKEIREHPVVGIGIGMGEDEGVELNEEGKINVEPGSSYLALLSMTGVLGGLGFTILLGWAAFLWHRSFQVLPPGHAPLLAGIGAFLGVHAIGEGWLLAVGSPLCFIFWLWLGRLVDLLQSAKGKEPARLGRRRPRTIINAEIASLRAEIGKAESRNGPRSA